MKEIKISIPDNCELIKERDSYVVKEKKKNNPPRSWEEFVKNYPIQKGETFIDIEGVINVYKESEVRAVSDKILCTNKEEAEAFLALMQLRQLRKAWAGEYKQVAREETAAIKYNLCQGLYIEHLDFGFFDSRCLSFPDKEMAEDFLSCFRDLCETAKILL